VATYENNVAALEARMGVVGIRELKNQLSRYLKRVGEGERLVVTERGRPVAVITPSSGAVADRRVEALLRDGLARWSGGKPRGARRPARVKGASVAEAVREGRR
ncbi:MAG TPA: type II toxin-antitoxin system prevent-host-death family antitoxin, partial [Methylomirabilota bacterium]|nr:type II toxin-antitoxin system prevent-host-death family antitoxin [Methylomirabilota bacterium]